MYDENASFVRFKCGVFRAAAGPVFFVACRGHHADIGGITPGSMPPHSTRLEQEGATFKSFLLVERGTFREKELTEEFVKPGTVEGSSGSRNLSDNISDLKAQIAANQKGILLVRELIDYYGLEVVQVRILFLFYVFDTLGIPERARSRLETKNLPIYSSGNFQQFFQQLQSSSLCYLNT